MSVSAAMTTNQQIDQRHCAPSLLAAAGDGSKNSFQSDAARRLSFFFPLGDVSRNGVAFQAVGSGGGNFVKQLQPSDDFKVQKAKFAGSRSRWPALCGFIWRRLSLRTQES